MRIYKSRFLIFNFSRESFWFLMGQLTERNKKKGSTSKETHSKRAEKVMQTMQHTLSIDENSLAEYKIMLNVSIARINRIQKFWNKTELIKQTRNMWNNRRIPNNSQKSNRIFRRFIHRNRQAINNEQWSIKTRRIHGI